MSPVDRAWTTRLLRDLVSIDSVNPAFGGPGEGELARRVAGCLQALDLEVTVLEGQPGRPSVLGTLRGEGGGRSLLLYAHLDTVGVQGMQEPFAASLRDGRVYGRGAYDMKGGLAACIAAARSLAEGTGPPAGDLHLGFVADEETESLGIRELLTRLQPDGAVVTEPTDLQMCVAHKGFAWIGVETMGRAAHGSRFEEGVDANLRMGRFLAKLDGLERELRARPGHPLVGPPSLHAATLHGGTGLSTYAAGCRVQIERRTVPGETPDAVLREIRSLVQELKEEDPDFQARVEPLLWRDAFEADPNSALARTLHQEATARLGRPPATIGETYWMDAALLASAGVDTLVLGPSGAGAHSAEEWVDVESVVHLADILARTAEEYCR
jgi:acetylornithine deacetylase